MVAHPQDLPRRHYTIEEYFAIERVGDARYEYWDGEIVCMSGGTPQHAIICSNLQMSLSRQLAQQKCRVFSSDLSIRTPALPPYRYPDISVVCGDPAFDDVEGIAVLINPSLIVEVLSPGTENRDRNEKRIAYQALSALREYLIVAQDAPHITLYTRHGDQWSRADFAELSILIDIPSIGCRLSLAEIYDGIDFS